MDTLRNDKFFDFIDEYDIILLTKFGSHLYGTNTPESDSDYKGIFIPTKEQLLLCDFPKTVRLGNNTNEKNTKDDIDCEVYSIHYFFELACSGQTVALDMLHANKESIIITSFEWEFIQKNRAIFYTKNMNAFVGYCMKQAAKYSIKGSRLASAKNFKKTLESLPQDDKLMYHWSLLPLDEHVFISETNSTINQINFCGKLLQDTIKVSYALDITNKFIDKYGERSKLAETNEGVDFKALSHAMRAAIQCKSILLNNDIVFPLKEADYLKDIKLGKYDFTYVMNCIEKEIDEIKQLSDKSNLPNKVNKKATNKLLLDVLKRYHL